MFTIEKDVPVPAPAKTGRPSGSKYPFDLLLVGESFFVDDISKWDSVKTMASKVKRVTGGSFRIALERDGFRVWRTS